jgi:hypothetical protein
VIFTFVGLIHLFSFRQAFLILYSILARQRSFMKREWIMVAGIFMPGAGYHNHLSPRTYDRFAAYQL